jgi:hypothetical protein
MHLAKGGVKVIEKFSKSNKRETKSDEKILLNWLMLSHPFHTFSVFYNRKIFWRSRTVSRFI